jgi:1,4-dihydroxy-2-naphthoate octaprenyltransferase
LFPGIFRNILYLEPRNEREGTVGNSLSLGMKLLSWLTLLRLGATARGILPFLLGAVIAWSRGYVIDGRVLALSSAAVFCIMLMTFLVNEYYDYQTDAANHDYHKLSGGSRILPMGLIPRRQALIAAHIFAGAAAGIGLWLYLALKTGPLTIPLGALAMATGYFYTAKPLKLSYRGAGEISIWFACGWLAAMMGYYLQTGDLSMMVTLVSLPGAFSIFSVILINEIPDMASDRLSGKKNLAVRLGLERAAWLYLSGLTISLICVFGIALLGAPSTSVYLSLLLVPLVVWIFYTAEKQGFGNKRAQESLSIRTTLYDHLITIIYAVSFALEGLKLAGPGISQLYILAGAFTIVLGMEGLSLALSRITLRADKAPQANLPVKSGVPVERG